MTARAHVCDDESCAGCYECYGTDGDHHCVRRCAHAERCPDCGHFLDLCEADAPGTCPQPQSLALS